MPRMLKDAHMPMCFACLRAHIPKCLACSRAQVPTCLACFYTHVPMSHACSRAYVLACHACPLAHMLTCLECPLAIFSVVKCPPLSLLHFFNALCFIWIGKLWKFKNIVWICEAFMNFKGFDIKHFCFDMKHYTLRCYQLWH